MVIDTAPLRNKVASKPIKSVNESPVLSIAVIKVKKLREVK
jgi:hypothetical protein